MGRLEAFLQKHEDKHQNCRQQSTLHNVWPCENYARAQNSENSTTNVSGPVPDSLAGNHREDSWRMWVSLEQEVLPQRRSICAHRDTAGIHV